MRFLGTLRHPLPWLLLLAAGVFYHLGSSGLLAPKRSPDAVSYEVPATAESLGEILSGVRTYGYPLLLRGVALFSAEQSPLPAIHALAYLAASLLFWYAVRVYSGSPWFAFAAALPLFWTDLLSYAPFVQPDLLAPALAVAAVALLVLLTARPSSRWLWAGLTAMVFVAYQTRPVFVFLVVLVPLMGPILRFCRESVAWARLRGWAVGLLVASAAPFLLYCGLRAAVVGHFGLIPFGGYEIVGIAASFLDPELVAELPAEDQGAAQRILRQRRRRQWEPYGPGSWTPRWHRQYGKNQWIAEPIVRPLVLAERAARGLGQGTGWESDREMVDKWAAREAPPLSGRITMAINDRLSRISWAIIERRPILWGKWIFDSFVYGVARMFDVSPWLRWLPPLIAVSLLPALLIPRRVRRFPVTTTGRRLLAIFLLGLVFLLGKLGLLVLLSWPFDRYLVAAALLLPIGLGAALFELWATILTGLRRLVRERA